MQKNVFLFLQGGSDKRIPSWAFVCNGIVIGQLFCFFLCMHTTTFQNMIISDLKITFHLSYSAQQSEYSHEKKDISSDVECWGIYAMG